VEPNYLHVSPNIVRMIKSKRMRWAGRVVRMGKGELYTGLWWGNLREGDHLEGPGVDGSIALRLIFRNGIWGMDRLDLAQDVYRRWALVKR